MSPEAFRRLRLFFALWPSDAQRQALATLTGAAVAPIQGKPVQSSNFHVTLAFLGNVRGSGLPELVALGGSARQPRVELGFNRLAYWAKPRVVVALPGKAPQSGHQIVDWLWTGLGALGFQREARPWQPHLTLVRHVRQPPPPSYGPELAARAAAAAATGWSLALVESTTHPEGALYRPLAEWELG